MLERRVMTEPRVKIVKGTTNRATALTHVERQKLVNKPFPQIRHLGRSYLWGGVQIVRELPTEGRKKSVYGSGNDTTLDQLLNVLEAE
jgi:hypothetical protein